jgi:dihydrolipoamide dehydrogenase
VLVATGRTPCLGDLDLDTTGFTINDDGVPLYNRHTMQCGDAPVFLAGDATKDSPVLHEASSRPVRLAITDPQSAIIGSKPGPESLIASADYDDQGRAVIEARAIGRIVIYAAPDGTLTGATLVAPAAEHLAHLLA